MSNIPREYALSMCFIHALVYASAFSRAFARLVFSASVIAVDAFAFFFFGAAGCGLQSGSMFPGGGGTAAGGGGENGQPLDPLQVPPPPVPPLPPPDATVVSCLVGGRRGDVGFFDQSLRVAT